VGWVERQQIAFLRGLFMDINFDDAKNLRMPVFSWDYEDLGEADHWFLMARAYFDSSYYLFAEMIKEKYERGF
jgi:hypothetical protein